MDLKAKRPWPQTGDMKMFRPNGDALLGRCESQNHLFDISGLHPRRPSEVLVEIKPLRSLNNNVPSFAIKSQRFALLSRLIKKAGRTGAPIHVRNPGRPGEDPRQGAGRQARRRARPGPARRGVAAPDHGVRSGEQPAGNQPARHQPRRGQSSRLRPCRCWKASGRDRTLSAGGTAAEIRP